MTSNIERRIEALEERPRGARLAVILQREDGTWPEEPDTGLVVRIRSFALQEPDVGSVRDEIPLGKARAS